MRLTIISDTHGDHEKLGTLSGDVLIYCGDMFSEGADDFEVMDDWFGRQNFDLIICIAGNHDFEIERRSKYVDNPFRSAVYLEGRTYTHKNVNFYGAPWIPGLHNQAFFKQEAELKTIWTEIPANTDVLITHSPPAGILDVSSKGMALGCQWLCKALDDLALKLHCFGHVHAGSGSAEIDSMTFINAALANREYQLARRTLRVSPVAAKGLWTAVNY
jgi:Icc-related predicted phosphoesterase